MVTDAAGTGFEIKKPHKGTETQKLLFYCDCSIIFEIKKPHKGTETVGRSKATLSRWII